MKKLDIINETEKAYSDPKNRAYNPNSLGSKCQYFDENTGNMCALGRCMIDPKRTQDKYGNFGAYDLDKKMIKEGECLDSHLRAEYEGHSSEFWADLQVFHDTSRYFTDNSISDGGLKYLESLRSIWGEE